MPDRSADRTRGHGVGKITSAKKGRIKPALTPGAFVVLKALAFASRGENKDAYDLFYVVRNYGSGVQDTADSLRPLLEDPAGREAMAILRRDFLDHNGVGPRRVAEFMTHGPDDAIQADVVGFVRQMLDRCG